jgi:hypothetical protein
MRPGGVETGMRIGTQLGSYEIVSRLGAGGLDVQTGTSPCSDLSAGRLHLTVQLNWKPK